MRLVRHSDQDARETYGAVHWNSMVLFQKAGGKKFSDSDWLQYFHQSSNKTSMNSRNVFLYIRPCWKVARETTMTTLRPWPHQPKRVDALMSPSSRWVLFNTPRYISAVKDGTPWVAQRLTKPPSTTGTRQEQDPHQNFHNMIAEQRLNVTGCVSRLFKCGCCEDISSIREDYATWRRSYPSSTLVRHLVSAGSANPVFRGAHDRRHFPPSLCTASTTSCPTVHFSRHASVLLKKTSREWHVIALHEAIEYFQHASREKKRHHLLHTSQPHRGQSRRSRNYRWLFKTEKSKLSQEVEHTQVSVYCITFLPSTRQRMTILTAKVSCRECIQFSYTSSRTEGCICECLATTAATAAQEARHLWKCV